MMCGGKTMCVRLKGVLCECGSDVGYYNLMVETSIRGSC